MSGLFLKGISSLKSFSLLSTRWKRGKMTQFHGLAYSLTGFDADQSDKAIMMFFLERLPQSFDVARNLKNTYREAKNCYYWYSFIQMTLHIPTIHV